jgi:hypothetical protein
MKQITLFFAIVAIVGSSESQQIDCTVRVNHEAVATSHKDLLETLEDDIRSYMNNHAWGNDNIDEKVKCTLDIFVKGAIGENKYSAQVFVGSRRHVYNTEKTSAVLRLYDEVWEFTYVKNRPLNHNTYSYNDLTSLLDFYAYLILGFDYDTYEHLGGTRYLSTAADIANLGRSTGQKGWQAGKGGYNRISLIEELLNQNFSPVRSAFYTYHFAGLDSLAASPSRAMANMLQAVKAIAQVRQLVDPRAVLIRTFFETKYLELADVFFTHPDSGVYIMLASIDPAHQATYEEYHRKKQ